MSTAMSIIILIIKLRASQFRCETSGGDACSGKDSGYLLQMKQRYDPWTTLDLKKIKNKMEVIDEAL